MMNGISITIGIVGDVIMAIIMIIIIPWKTWVELTGGGKSLAEVKIQRGRCDITITICSSDDAIESHTQTDKWQKK